MYLHLVWATRCGFMPDNGRKRSPVDSQEGQGRWNESEGYYRDIAKAPGKAHSGAFLLIHPRVATFYSVVSSSTEAP